MILYSAVGGPVFLRSETFKNSNTNYFGFRVMRTETSSLWKAKGPISRTLLFEGAFRVGKGACVRKSLFKKFLILTYPPNDKNFGLKGPFFGEPGWRSR